MSIQTGIDVGEMFNKGTQGLADEGAKIQEMMNKISTDESINQEDLLEIQFAMGQYNAKLETLSSITKSIQDMLKSLAQRTG